MIAEETLVPGDYQNEKNDKYSSSYVWNGHVRTEQDEQYKNAYHEVTSTLNVTLRDDFQTRDVVVNRDKNYNECHEVDRISKYGLHNHNPHEKFKIIIDAKIHLWHL